MKIYNNIAIAFSATVLVIVPDTANGAGGGALRGALRRLVGGSIGAGACDYYYGMIPCTENSGEIGENACRNQEACYRNKGTIGANACHGAKSCSENTGTIGAGACTGFATNLEGVGWRGPQFSCQNNKGTINDGCCVFGENWTYDCKNNPEGSTVLCDQDESWSEFPIGEDACNGNNACANRDIGMAIGARACQGENACLENGVTIGEDACVGKMACGRNKTWKASVGARACHGEKACNDNTGKIGEDACVGEMVCETNSGDILEGACHGELACDLNTGTIKGDACIGEHACPQNTGMIEWGCCVKGKNWNEICEHNDKHIDCDLGNSFDRGSNPLWRPLLSEPSP